ncbi:MAG: cadherin-like domain-containing protein [Nitrospirae bacterium]|nr:cadherin-like domain-containing protein [Nitrospirota bacterium]
MKKRQHYLTSQAAICLLAIAIVCAVMIVRTAWGIIVVPPPALNPLNQSAVTEPPQLFTYVKNKSIAIQIGKAFFWEMQAGSDGIVACATCHHSAGVDKRLKNTLNPGTKAGDTIFGNNTLGVNGFSQFGPNYTLDPVNDFPLHQRDGSGHLQTDPIIRDTNDVIGSQGVRLSDFVGVGVFPDPSVDSALAAEADTVFHDPVYGNLRRVTGRNAPTMINAVFNFTNFWDGRANFRFNGENPFGPADANAGVWFDDPAQPQLVKRPVVIEFASLASQAVGPPLDSVEMSGRGRTFPMLGRKLLGLTPLGKQLVSHDDSVLGGLANSAVTPGAKGLHTGYAQLIREAFNDNLWNSSKLTPDGFTQMEANFSLFWGLAIQLYEATLVSGDSPFDRWLAGDTTALTEQQQFGFSLFAGVGNCTVCHIGTELTAHSIANIGFLNNTINNTIELMFAADGVQNIYDEGFVNNAIRPTAEDLSRGGTAPFTNLLTGQPFPLSFSRLAELQEQALLPFETPILQSFIPVNMPVVADGAFKVPGLRNVELTGPYFHNGSEMTLDSVVNFYSRGGNFPAENIHNLDPVIGAGLTLISNNQTLHVAITDFLTALTDPRVRNESAPFDHPELFIPEGDPEVLTHIPARDSNGVPAPQLALTLNAVLSPTNSTAQTISGTVQAGMTTPAVTVNGGAPVNAIVTGITWSADIGGFQEGANAIEVSAVEIASSIQTSITATITLDTTPPSLTLNAVSTPTGLSTQIISGTVEAGAAVHVSVNGGAASAATVTGTSWSYTAGLTNAGDNTIEVSANDAIGNTTTLPVATIFRNMNTPPVAANDAAMTAMNVSKTINVTANDTGVSNALAPNTLAASAPLHGTAAANLDGTITYTPVTGFTGTDVFTYTVKDIIGNVSNSATVTVSVTSPVSETVTVLRAQFRTATATTGDWVVEGTTTNLLATTITIYSGNSLTGTVIGTASPIEGLWSFRQSGSSVLPDATRTISVQSSPLGTSRPAYPAAVR